MSERRFNVAVIGAGPAGIYASDILAKSSLDCTIDLFERLPAPYGLVRYGVAPDHPRIKAIINALFNVLKRGDISFHGNVNIGTDITLSELHDYYDAIIIATGANADAPLEIPGIDLEGSYGAADFVSWYDGHPDYPRTWPLEAKEIAVLGVGNVALDVARVLAKHPEDLLSTEIPPNVYEGLKNSPVTDVHVFGRRGPAQVKFTPMELRELGHVPDVDIIVYPEDFDYDDGSEKAIAESKMTKQVTEQLTNWVFQEPEDLTASRRIHIHMLQQPVAVLGQGKVEAVRMERTALQGDGSVKGTGEFIDYPVQAVYRAVGYASEPIPGAPFDAARHVIPNEGGRVQREMQRNRLLAGAHLQAFAMVGQQQRKLLAVIAGKQVRRRQCGLVDAGARHKAIGVERLAARHMRGHAGMDAHLRIKGAHVLRQVTGCHEVGKRLPQMLHRLAVNGLHLGKRGIGVRKQLRGDIGRGVVKCRCHARSSNFSCGPL